MRDARYPPLASTVSTVTTSVPRARMYATADGDAFGSTTQVNG
jgi:hypothetical protein